MSSANKYDCFTFVMEERTADKFSPDLRESIPFLEENNRAYKDSSWEEWLRKGKESERVAERQKESSR